MMICISVAATRSGASKYQIQPRVVGALSSRVQSTKSGDDHCKVIPSQPMRGDPVNHVKKTWQT